MEPFTAPSPSSLPGEAGNRAGAAKAAPAPGSHWQGAGGLPPPRAPRGAAAGPGPAADTRGLQREGGVVAPNPAGHRDLKAFIHPPRLARLSLVDLTQ